MNIYSYRTNAYKSCLEKLPKAKQEEAKQVFLEWARDGGVGSRRLNVDSDVISVKIDGGGGNRALGVLIDCPKPNSLAVVWFFIGKHSDYEHLMKASRLDTTISQIRARLPHYRREMANQGGLVKAKPKLGRIVGG